MNKTFEPFVDFIRKHGSKEIPEEPRKQYKDRYRYASFHNLTPNELRNSGLSDDDLSSAHITFQTKEGMRYRAIHIKEHIRGPYILLCGLDGNESNFRTITHLISKNIPAIIRDSRLLKGFGRDKDIRQSLDLKTKPSQKDLADCVDNFYSKRFHNVLIEKVYYDELLVEDYQHSGLPHEKAEVDDIKKPSETVKKRKDLIQLCEEHSKSATQKIRENNVVAIHPYHDELGWGRGSKRAQQIQNLQNLLSNLNLDKYGIILIDSCDHYALRSHELVDTGRIAKVIFTKESSPDIVSPDELKLFSDTKENYYCGAYANQCVKWVVDKIKKHGGNPKLRPIHDTLLYFRHDKGEFVVGEFDPSRYYRLQIISSFLFGVKCKDLLNEK